MKKIEALREFSHYHLGNFSQSDTKQVSDDQALALEGMGLAKVVPDDESPPEKSGAKRGRKNGD